MRRGVSHVLRNRNAKVLNYIKTNCICKKKKPVNKLIYSICLKIEKFWRNAHEHFSASIIIHTKPQSVYVFSRVVSTLRLNFCFYFFFYYHIYPMLYRTLQTSFVFTYPLGLASLRCRNASNPLYLFYFAFQTVLSICVHVHVSARFLYQSTDVLCALTTLIYNFLFTNLIL